jgi:hypothetical protein
MLAVLGNGFYRQHGEQFRCRGLICRASAGLHPLKRYPPTS